MSLFVLFFIVFACLSVSFCGLIKGISPKMCILCVHVEINKCSFEPFWVWITIVSLIPCVAFLSSACGRWWCGLVFTCCVRWPVVNVRCWMAWPSSTWKSQKTPRQAAQRELCWNSLTPVPLLSVSLWQLFPMTCSTLFGEFITTLPPNLFHSIWWVFLISYPPPPPPSPPPTCSTLFGEFITPLPLTCSTPFGEFIVTLPLTFSTPSGEFITTSPDLFHSFWWVYHNSSPDLFHSFWWVYHNSSPDLFHSFWWVYLNSSPLQPMCVCVCSVCVCVCAVCVCICVCLL